MDIDGFWDWLKNRKDQGTLIGIALIALVLAAYHIDRPYAWIIGLSALVIVLLLLFFFGPSGKDMKEDVWFKAIVAHLEDASTATIYLRHFQHPDDFRPEHRQALLDIMNCFVKNIIEHPETFRIVAYRETHATGKDPREWIRSELHQRGVRLNPDELLERCVRVIHRQPGANSSTVYVIDDNVILYTYVPARDRAQLFSLDLARSLLPKFISSGIDNLFRGI
jgi:hypothetical protein